MKQKQAMMVETGSADICMGNMDCALTKCSVSQRNQKPSLII
jgi:hypothetical protein